MKNNKRKEIPLNNIGIIKTKHIPGHNVLIYAGLGASVGTIVGIATRVCRDAGESSLFSGAITGVNKQIKSFEINEDTKNTMSSKLLWVSNYK
ncbi:hypothetical protein [Formosa maritima]|uniref:Uncharacterized protein n=1 Tax=Formosa maritima TaxID=2592046 RepID=A0A5D0GG79_9FLAO|nr:hypothetical protein [Formosa maritima]TYA57984.1 hypothetical protein FVF61_04010 [Formosa maritima]